MFKRIRTRLDGNTEQGFTLIELLVVIIIIGILLAIAVPSYLGFRDRAANNAMKANLRAALPSAEAYYADNGSYTGMTRQPSRPSTVVSPRPSRSLRPRPRPTAWPTPTAASRGASPARRIQHVVQEQPDLRVALGSETSRRGAGDRASSRFSPSRPMPICTR